MIRMMIACVIALISIFSPVLVTRAHAETPSDLNFLLTPADVEHTWSTPTLAIPVSYNSAPLAAPVLSPTAVANNVPSNSAPVDQPSQTLLNGGDTRPRDIAPVAQQAGGPVEQAPPVHKLANNANTVPQLAPVAQPVLTNQANPVLLDILDEAKPLQSPVNSTMHLQYVVPVAQPVIHPTADAQWPEYTSHRCVGIPLYNLTCHFSNLIYDRASLQYKYFAAPGADTSEISGMVFFEDGMQIQILHEPFYTPLMACDDLEPEYLYAMIKPNSFANLLRDTLVTMYANLLALGLDDQDHRILVVRSMYSNKEGPAYESGVRLIARYAEWAGSNSETLAHFASACPKSHILFRSIVVGSLLLRSQPAHVPDRPVVNNFGGVDGPIVRGFRDATYARHGFDALPPAASHAPIKVLFHDKLIANTRRITNIPILLGALRAQFPHMITDSKVLSLLSPHDQLVELRTTSILITPHGSTSFRAIFLPDGAQMISIGPDETGGMKEAAWIEFNVFFQKLSYVKHHCYHCTEEFETSVATQSRMGIVPQGVSQEQYLWWHSDKRPKTDKLKALVEDATRSIVASATQILPNGTFVAFTQHCIDPTYTHS